MAIVPMKKIYIMAHKGTKERLVSYLQELGVLQIVSLEEEELRREEISQVAVSFQEIEETISALKHTVEFLQKSCRQKIAGVFVLEKEQLEHIVQHFNFQECFYRCRRLEEELGKLETRRTLVTAQIQQLKPWLNTAVNLAELIDSAQISYFVGSFKIKKNVSFREVLAQELRFVHVEEVGRKKDAWYGVFIVATPEREKAQEVLKTLAFNQQVFPKIKATPAKLYQRLARELARLEKRKEKLLQECKEVAQGIPKLQALIDYYLNVREHSRIQTMFLQSDKTIIFNGWLPARRELELRQKLERRFTAVEVISRAPVSTETPPVEIENKKVIRPFEVVTELYGYPVYTGIDPTIYLAPFFALFFGICLGDAGYGIVVVAATLFLLWKRSRRLTTSSRKFFWLFFTCGIFAIFAGIAMGSFFGIPTSFKLFNPLSQLSLFLGLSFGLGLVHVFTGLIIRMRENIQTSGWWAAIWEQGAWMLLIISLITIGGAGMLGLSEALKKTSLFLAVIGAGFIVLFQARSEDKNVTKDIDVYQLSYLGLTFGAGLWLAGILSPLGKIITFSSLFFIAFLGRKNLKGILARIGLGFYNLYGITSYLGDVLSYSRLVALGLGGGVIAMVVNTMAGLAKDLIPGVGLIAAGLILVGGHTFNLAMSLLSAFVHTARLQYVEFFGKFYASGGRKFKPFSWEFKNIMLLEQSNKK